jgi:hypothetical protein
MSKFNINRLNALSDNVFNYSADRFAYFSHENNDDLLKYFVVNKASDPCFSYRGYKMTKITIFNTNHEAMNDCAIYTLELRIMSDKLPTLDATLSTLLDDYRVSGNTNLDCIEPSDCEGFDLNSFYPILRAALDSSDVYYVAVLNVEPESYAKINNIPMLFPSFAVKSDSAEGALIEAITKFKALIS